MNAQERARDGARAVKVGQIATAIDLYKEEHDGKYPLAAFYASTLKKDIQVAAVSPSEYNLRSFFDFAPSVFAAGQYSTVAMVANKIGGYISSVPTDPGKGIAATDDKNATCMLTGDSFGYYTDSGGNMYAVTSLMESKKGNTTNCLGVVDADNTAGYNVVGKGLIYKPQPTDTSCFVFSDSPTWPGMISSYKNTCPKNVVIPDKINGIPIQTISFSTFSSKEINSVVIPNTVRKIYGYAFAGNNLSSIKLPDNLQHLGEAVFRYNKLTEVYIPASVIWVERWTFVNNPIVEAKVDSYTMCHSYDAQFDSTVKIICPK